MTVSVLCVFLMVPWVGLQFVIVAFSGHTHLMFGTGEEHCIKSVDLIWAWKPFWSCDLDHIVILHRRTILNCGYLDYTAGSSKGQMPTMTIGTYL